MSIDRLRSVSRTEQAMKMNWFAFEKQIDANDLCWWQQGQQVVCLVACPIDLKSDKKRSREKKKD